MKNNSCWDPLSNIKNQASSTPLFKVSQQASPIGHGRDKFAENIKLTYYEGTRSLSQSFTKKLKDGFLLSEYHLYINKAPVFPKYTFEFKVNEKSKH